MNKKVLIIIGIIVAVVLLWTVTKGMNRGIVMDHSSSEAKTLYDQATRLAKAHELLKAKEVYLEILKTYPDFDKIAQVQKDLENVNMTVLFSNMNVPEKTVVHEVVPGDTLGKIAKQYGTTVEFIKKSNNLKSNVIRVGQTLRIWTGTFNLFVDKSQNILILKDGNEVLKVYNVSTGENNCTPTGTFKIVTKLVDPVWFNRGVVVPPDSPQNVLGTRWMGFDLSGYGIHGTIEPETIGRQVTAGCVRMQNKEVEELYDLVILGTTVVVVD